MSRRLLSKELQRCEISTTFKLNSLNFEGPHGEQAVSDLKIFGYKKFGAIRLNMCIMK